MSEYKKLVRNWAPGTLVGMLACAMWSVSAYAQECTISNWVVDGVATPAVNLTDANAGRPNQAAPLGGNFRRYAGPCALRVPVGGDDRYLRDGSPANETSYNARFYAFLNNAGGDVTLFRALGAGDTVQIEIGYRAAARSLDLRVRNASGAFETLSFTKVPAGWHSIRFEWKAAPSANIVFALNSDDPADFARLAVDTTGAVINEVRLGSMSATAAAGSFVDFDDFDSRRNSVPGRLVRGAADSGTSNVAADIVAVRNELLGLGLAPGQPDCDENGEVGASDIVCVRSILLGN